MRGVGFGRVKRLPGLRHEFRGGKNLADAGFYQVVVGNYHQKFRFNRGVFYEYIRLKY
jgi:hypothetical protein